MNLYQSGTYPLTSIEYATQLCNYKDDTELRVEYFADEFETRPIVTSHTDNHEAASNAVKRCADILQRLEFKTEKAAVCSRFIARLEDQHCDSLALADELMDLVRNDVDPVGSTKFNLKIERGENGEISFVAPPHKLKAGCDIVVGHAYASIAVKYYQNKWEPNALLRKLIADETRCDAVQNRKHPYYERSEPSFIYSLPEQSLVELIAEANLNYDLAAIHEAELDKTLIELTMEVNTLTAVSIPMAEKKAHCLYSIMRAFTL